MAMALHEMEVSRLQLTMQGEWAISTSITLQSSMELCPVAMVGRRSAKSALAMHPPVPH